MSEIEAFSTVAKTIKNNYRTILNLFKNKATNASAESFNTKIKEFRSQFRGVTDIKFLLKIITPPKIQIDPLKRLYFAYTLKIKTPENN